MSKDLKIQVVLSALDNLTTPFKKASLQANKLSQNLSNAKNKLNELEKTQNLINAFKQTKEAIHTNNQAMVEAKNKAQQLAQQLNATTNPTAKMKRAFEQARNAVKNLKISQDEQIQKLRTQREALKKCGINTRNLGNAQKTLKEQIEKTNKSIEAQKIKLGKLNKFKKSQDRLKEQAAQSKSFGQSALIKVAAMGALGYKMLAPAVEFESAFSKVQALTRLDKNNQDDLVKINSLKQQALDLGASTAFTSAQVAEAQGYLAMAGFNAEQIQASMQSVLNMSMASGADLARVSDVASDISSGFKIPADQMGRVADVLTLTFTTSNTSLETLYETMKEGAPVMTSLGQSMESTAAMAGLLGNVGIKGSQAGTTLKNIGLNMIGNKTLKDLGVKVQDKKGNMRQLPQILADIKKATDKMGTAQRSQVIKDIFGKIPIAGAMELISQADGALQNYEKSLLDAKGTVEKVSKTMTDNLMGDLKGLESAKEAIGISAYQLLVAELRNLTQGFTNVLQKINKWIQENPKLAKWILIIGSGLATLATALGIAALTWGYILSPIITAARAVWAFNAALMANPITWIILGIVALIAAIVLLVKNWDKVKAVASAVADYLLQKWQAFSNWFNEKWIALLTWLEQKWNALKSTGETTWNGIQTAVSSVLSPLDSVISGVSWLIDNLSKLSWEGIKDGAAAVKDYASNKVSGAWNWVKEKTGFGDNPEQAPPLENKWIGGLVGNGKGFAQGGYTGNGGKYDPAGIVHRGEYVMTKAATSRLGVPLLNALNYSKNALLATGLGVSVATAAPVQVDNRPPLKQSQPQIVASQPMQVTINVNATAGQDANAIAKEVARQLAQLQNQQQIKNRSSLWDRD